MKKRGGTASEVTEFQNPQFVRFVKSRWDVVIQIVDAQGAEHEFIASADGFFTDRDHIWFSTIAEYEEYYEENK